LREDNGTAQILVDSATNQQVDPVTSATAEQLHQATDNAREAQVLGGLGSNLTRILLILTDAIERDAENLTKVEVQAADNPCEAFQDDEFTFAADNLRIFADFAQS
jgi:acyl-CoA reductase-like NAD-dependent aldehyde dehydrogenase